MGLFDHRKTDPGAFAQEVIRALKTTGVDGVTFDPEAFSLQSEDVGTIYLGNVHPEYAGARRKERAAVIDRFVAGMAAVRDELPTDWDEARPNLRPTVRSPWYYHQVNLQAGLAGADPVAPIRQLLADTLAVDIAYDREDSISNIRDDHLEAWDVSFDQALEAALDNLRRDTDTPLETLRPGLYASVWGDAYDSSRILTPDVLYRHDVSGDPVVMIPVRDTLLLTGDRDDEGLAMMVELAGPFLDKPRWVSFEMFKHDGTSWVPFTPPGPAGAQLRQLRLRERMTDYDQQKSLLDTMHDERDIDIFVATYKGMENPDTGEVWSYCTWSEGVDTLLPITDRVVLYRPDRASEDESFVELGWETLRERYAELMVLEPHTFPPRYRVSDFPPESDWAALKAMAGETKSSS